MSTAAIRRKKGKRVALPRVTLLAYGKRDLIEFTTAVESLRHLVFDLKTQVDQLKQELGKKRRRKPDLSDKGTNGADVPAPIAAAAQGEGKEGAK